MIREVATIQLGWVMMTMLTEMGGWCMWMEVSYGCQGQVLTHPRPLYFPFHTLATPSCVSNGVNE